MKSSLNLLRRISIGMLFFSMPSSHVFASAVHDFYEIPAFFSEMYNARNKIFSHRQAIKNVQDAEKNVRESEKFIKEAEFNSAEAARWLDEAKKNLEELRRDIVSLHVDLERAYEEYAAAQTDLDELNRQILDAENELGASFYEQGDIHDDTTLEGRIEQLWRQFQYEPNRLSEVRNIIASEYGIYVELADVEGTEVPVTREDLLEQIADLRDDRTDRMDDVTSAEQDIKELTAEIAKGEQEQIQAQTDLKNADDEYRLSLRDIVLAKKDYRSALADLKTAQRELLHEGVSRFEAVGTEYYNASGNGYKGHQLYTSYDIGYEYAWGGVGIASGYVHSVTGKPSGRVASKTDTSVNVTYRNKHKKNDVNYLFSVNLPTGESDASIRASFPELLARYSTFGEGWNFTPGIEVVHHLNETDDLSFRLSYSLRRGYDMRQGIFDESTYRFLGEAHADVAPGNLLRKEIRYLHAGAKEQFLTFITHQSATDSTVSPRDNDLRRALLSLPAGDKTVERDQYFTDGWEYQIGAFYSQDYSQKDSYQLYTLQMYTKQYGGSCPGIRRQMYGVGVTHQFDSRQKMDFMVQYLKGKGSTNGWRNDLGVSDPHRLSFLLGYDVKLSERESLRIQLEQYKQKDRASGDYHGWNVSAIMNWNF